MSSPLPNALVASPPPAAPRRPLGPWEWRLVGLLTVCFLCRNLPWRLDEFDQAKQAFVSLEMVGAGHWGFQHTPGDALIATKPPLMGWLSAGLYYLLAGHWDIAWRLPSFVAALVLAALLWRAGESLWPNRGGLVAMAAFSFNLLAPRLATLVRTDMLLTLWTAAVGLIVWQHARDARRPWTPRARWTVFGLLVAAMMTKGPIVYAFLLPGMLFQTWLQRRRGQAVTLWGGWWHWTLPLVPFLLWLGWGMETVPGFSDQVVGHEFLGRFTVGEKAVHHNQPIYFYLTQLLARWMPWSALLLAVSLRTPFLRFVALWLPWLARRMAGPARVPLLWTALCREPGTLWLVCWAAGGFVLLSLVPSKRTDRIFPVVPPLCLVLTAVLARAQRAPEADPVAAVPAIPDLPGTTVPPAPPIPMPPAAPAAWPWHWARTTAAVAVAVGVATTVGGIIQVYYKHENARARFGAQALALLPGKAIGLVAPQIQETIPTPPGKNAARSKKRVGGADVEETDETMLVYLRQQAFLTPAEAIQRWSVGKLDAIVVNEHAREQLGGLLAPFSPSQPQLVSTGPGPAYLLLIRHTAPAPPPPPPRRSPGH